MARDDAEGSLGPTISPIHVLVSELNRTFCRFTSTEPGVTPIHPDNRVNHMRAVVPTRAATSQGGIGATRGAAVA